MRFEDNKYELMIILDSEKGYDACNKKLEAVKKMISEVGDFFFEDVWGDKDLAYPMNKKERGYYAVYNFSYDPTKMEELNRTLRLDSEIVRHLIVKLPHKYTPKTLEELKAEHEQAEEAEAK